MKKIADPASALDAIPPLPDDFLENLTVILAIYILPHMGGVRVTKLEKFVGALCAVRPYIWQLEEEMALQREGESAVRAARIRCGRAKAAVQHSIISLQKAESIRKEMIDKDGFNSKWINFKPAQDALQGIEKIFAELESTTAAVIHPSLRKGKSEEELATKTPYQPTHSKFKVTPGSQAIMHHAIEKLDDEIQKFTGGKVKPVQVNKFIKKFLEFSFKWTVDVSNVKTIRKRYDDRKKSVAVASNTPPARP